MNENRRLIFLDLIYSKENILFGSFSDTLTKEDKTAAWKSIVDDRAQIYGFNPVPTGKPWSHIRDSIWPKFKNYTMRNRDAKQKTGEPGGADVKYSKIDLKVLDIIGSKSPAVEGLNVPEAGIPPIYTFIEHSSIRHHQIRR
uniref:Uncharacterized protein n=1 Tax=Romanomermis culicivorax TaxID=13658 RepID=A0A915HQC2_ROMCU